MSNNEKNKMINICKISASNLLKIYGSDFNNFIKAETYNDESSNIFDYFINTVPNFFAIAFADIIMRSSAKDDKKFYDDIKLEVFSHLDSSIDQIVAKLKKDEEKLND